MLWAVLPTLVVATARAAAFVPAQPLNSARYHHTATLLANGKVLVVGGMGESGHLATAELYDPATGFWTTTGTMDGARRYHTATLLTNGLLLVAGGQDSGYAPVSSARLYNPTNGNWTATGTMGSARYLHRAILLSNGRVLVAGGLGGAGALASAELYDPASGGWLPTGSMTNSCYDHTATLLASGKILVAGGVAIVGGNYVYQSSAQLYDPAAGTWTGTRSLNVARGSHTATLLANGWVLVTGGYGGTRLASVEMYNPAAAIWVVTNALNAAREFHTATLLFDGKVLVAGGLANSGSLSNAQVFNPPTGTWTSTSALITPRDSHTETRMTNGAVLVAGGYNDGILSSVELYYHVLPPITLSAPRMLPDKSFRFNFASAPGTSNAVFATTNPGNPMNTWAVLNGVVEIAPGWFQFTDPQAANHPRRFYRVRSP